MTVVPYYMQYIPLKKSFYKADVWCYWCFFKVPQQETEENWAGKCGVITEVRRVRDAVLISYHEFKLVQFWWCYICFLRALHHVDRLKTLVEDMNDRKVRAEDDGTDCTDRSAANITDWVRINKRLWIRNHKLIILQTDVSLIILD